VKLDCADVIEMLRESVQTLPCFVVPHLNFVVVTTRDEKRLGGVKSDATNGTFMLLKTIN
jgi:hypothetical protein